MSRLVHAAIALSALLAAAEVVALEPMHDDHRSILIFGHAIGRDGESGQLSVFLNRVEFTVTTPPAPFAANSAKEGLAPIESCEALSDQIGSYTVELYATPEFDADCIALPGGGAMLLMQANPGRYPAPEGTEEDDPLDSWLKRKRRYLFVEAASSDDGQTIRVK